MTSTFRTVFIQRWGTYSYDTIVAVGMTKAQVLAWMKRSMPKDAKALKEFEEDEGEAFEHIKESKGIFYRWESGRSVILLKRFNGSFFDLDVIAHEVHHAVFHFAKDLGLEDETEAQAYQFEYINRGIRQELYKRRKLHLKK